MKLKILTLFIISAIGFSQGCQKVKPEDGTPKCLKKEIRNFNRHARHCGKTWVEAYTFQAQTVYVFREVDCHTKADFAYPVYDSNCNKIGHLGGIAGNTKINGESFDNAVLIGVVYHE